MTLPCLMRPRRTCFTTTPLDVSLAARSVGALVSSSGLGQTTCLCPEILGRYAKYLVHISFRQYEALTAELTTELGGTKVYITQRSFPRASATLTCYPAPPVLSTRPSQCHHDRLRIIIHMAVQNPRAWCVFLIGVTALSCQDEVQSQ